MKRPAHLRLSFIGNNQTWCRLAHMSCLSNRHTCRRQFLCKHGILKFAVERVECTCGKIVKTSGEVTSKDFQIIVRGGYPSWQRCAKSDAASRADSIHGD